MPLCRIFLHPSDLTYDLLQRSTGYLGNNPRRCFEASSSAANFEAKKIEAESEIKRISRNMSAEGMMQMTQGTQKGVFDSAYLIYGIFPNKVKENQLLSDCHFESVSKWAFNLMMDQVEESAASPYKAVRARAESLWGRSLT